MSFRISSIRIRSCLWAAVAAALVAGPVEAAQVVYDSTNFITSGSTGYGVVGSSVTDLSRTYGDWLHLTATGKLTSFTFCVLNSASSAADLTSATETIRFYRQSDSSLIGGFTTTLGFLARGYYSPYTVDNLDSSNIVLDTADILVTQQLSSVVGSTRMGVAASSVSTTPAVGTTAAGFYNSAVSGTFVLGTYPSASSLPYKAVVLTDVTWNTTTGTWDTSSTNWTFGSGANQAFTNGSQATFNNSSGGTVSLSGPLAPSAVVVSATAGTYTFTTSAGNLITGTTGLSKSGAGTLVLSGPNTYSGGTTISSGTLVLGSADAIGSSGTISFGGGTLQSSASNTADYSARFSSAASQQYKIDTNGQNVTLASNLTSSGGSFTKLGTGKLTLSGNNTYSGPTSVQAGTLSLSGTLANSAVTVGAGGTLAGSGFIGSSLTVLASGTLAPGNSPGRITTGSLELQAGSTTSMEIVGLTSGSASLSGTAGTDYDNVLVSSSGGLTYGGALSIVFSNTNPFANGTVFDLFAFTGSAAGAFASITTGGSGDYAQLTFSPNVDGSWYTPDTAGGQYLKFSPSTGDLVVVPEPSTWAMMLTGAAVAAGMARRKRISKPRAA